MSPFETAPIVKSLLFVRRLGPWWLWDKHVRWRVVAAWRGRLHRRLPERVYGGTSHMSNLMGSSLMELVRKIRMRGCWMLYPSRQLFDRHSSFGRPSTGFGRGLWRGVCGLIVFVVGCMCRRHSRLTWGRHVRVCSPGEPRWRS